MKIRECKKNKRLCFYNEAGNCTFSPANIPYCEYKRKPIRRTRRTAFGEVKVRYET